MKQNSSTCQVSSSSNPNTAIFWNRKISKFKNIIVESPIFNHKNYIVLKELSNLRGKVLDVGIGYGFIENIIVKNKLNYDLFGIDISPYAIKLANKNLKGNFKVARVDDIPYKSRYFDVVLALDILEHLTDVELCKALSEINRVLVHDGNFIISIPMNESDADRKKNRHLQEFNFENLNSMLIESGFKIKKIKYFSAFANNFFIKNLINNILKIKKPNLLILIATKN